MKNFYSRHPMLVGGLVALLLFFSGVILSIFGRTHFSIPVLIFVIAVAVYIGSIFFSEKWIWVCPACKKEAFLQRNKYCSACGNKMVLSKKPKPILCSRKHPVDKTYEFCPKCGEHLR